MSGGVSAAVSGPLPVRRCETHAELGSGIVLLRRAWLPPEPERVLLVVHGLAEHSGRYDRLGAWFARRGCAVHAYDQRGHGRSGGRRGHVRRFAQLLRDLEELLERVRAQHAGLPLVLVGHSMGGLVVASFVRERAPEIDGAVVSGGTLAVPDGISPLRRAGARALRRLAPRGGLAIGIDPGALSRDPEVGRRYVEDPLVFDRMTLSLATELIGAIERTATAGGAAVRVPMLLLCGADDAICDPAGSRAFRAGIQAPGSALVIYEGLRHEIFNEPECERVYQDVLDWLRKRDSGACQGSGAR